MRRRRLDFGDRRVAPVAKRARSLGAFSLVLFVVSGLGHRYGLIETVPFLWLLGIVFLIAVVAILAAWLGFLRLWNHGDRAGRASLAGLLLASLTLAPFAAALWMAVWHPALSDVMTDLEDPPSFRLLAAAREGAMNRIGPPAPVALDLHRAAYPALAGRRYALAPETLRPLVLDVVRQSGWRVAAQSAEGEERTTLEAEAPTRVLRFPVDAAVRLTRLEESTLVDLRMSSRYGAHDLGDGARRIVRFLADLDLAVSAFLELPPAPPDDEADDSGGEEDATE